MKRFWGIVLLVVSACGTPYVVRHTVMVGEDAASIAQAYGMTEGHLRELNRLGPRDLLRPGDTIFVPGAPSRREQAVTAPATPPVARPGVEEPRPSPVPPPPPPAPPRQMPPVATRLPMPRPLPPPPPPEPAPAPPRPSEPKRDAGPARSATSSGVPSEQRRRGGLEWPLQGDILRGFGKGPAGENRGVDIGAEPGTEVRAAAGGRVTYAGVPARAYGPVLILEHGDGLHTVYSNLREVKVKRGEEVDAGQAIGTSGEKAITPLPHLHFEVRKNGQAVDPLLFLPPR